jgi:hypothetical protein
MASDMTPMQVRLAVCKLPEDIQSIMWNTYYRNHVLQELNDKTSDRLFHYEFTEECAKKKIKEFAYHTFQVYTVNPVYFKMSIDFIEENILDAIFNEYMDVLWETVQITKDHAGHPHLLYITLCSYGFNSIDSMMQKLGTVMHISRMLYPYLAHEEE